jgi:hypothetical protein
MARHLVLALTLLGPLVLGGCLAERDVNTAREDLENPELPYSYQEARYLEDEGVEALAHGHETRDTERRRRYFDEAIEYFRQAHALYEDELLTTSPNPDRARNLEQEMDRLMAMVEDTNRERPID